MNTTSNENTRLTFTNGILYLEYINDAHHDLKMSKECVTFVNSFIEELGVSQVSLLIKTDFNPSFSIKARQHMILDESVKHLSAITIVTSNLSQRFMAEFFLKVTKPKVPVKLFSNEQKAILWLDSYGKLIGSH